MKKVYLGIVDDHSGSMGDLRTEAINDYNSIIESYRKEAGDEIQVHVSVLPFDTRVENFTEFFTDIKNVKNITDYYTKGMTALLDGIGKMMAHFEQVPKHEDTQFMIMIRTDGAENSSNKWNVSNLSEVIRQAQATGDWTITLRTPDTHESRDLAARLNIPTKNIFFWDGRSKESFAQASAATDSGITRYMSASKLGVKSSSSFYTDLSNVTPEMMQTTMKDISSEVAIYTTTSDEVIVPFVERMRGSFVKGTAYYQLTKPEREVQNYKLLLVRDKKSGSVYGGRNARMILNLPEDRSCKIIPGDHGQYEIFIQSTSINRKLPKGTMLAIWDPVQVYSKMTQPSVIKQAILPPSKQAILPPVINNPVQFPQWPTSQQIQKPLATKTPLSKTSEAWKRGFKDGKAHKRRNESDTDYLAGYKAGNASTKK